MFHSFDSLEHWLRGLPDQVDGLPSAICEAGEPYLEFHEVALARPGDEKAVEATVSGVMGHRLHNYLEGRKGRIYWRKRLETEVVDWEVIVQYDENGPDTDPITARRCVKDKSWRKVSCYCRLYRATHAADFSLPIGIKRAA